MEEFVATASAIGWGGSPEVAGRVFEAHGSNADMAMDVLLFQGTPQAVLEATYGAPEEPPAQPEPAERGESAEDEPAEAADIPATSPHDMVAYGDIPRGGPCPICHMLGPSTQSGPTLCRNCLLCSVCCKNVQRECPGSAPGGGDEEAEPTSPVDEPTCPAADAHAEFTTADGQLTADTTAAIRQMFRAACRTGDEPAGGEPPGEAGEAGEARMGHASYHRFCARTFLPAHRGRLHRALRANGSVTAADLEAFYHSRLQPAPPSEAVAALAAAAEAATSEATAAADAAAAAKAEAAAGAAAVAGAAAGGGGLANRAGAAVTFAVDARGDDAGRAKFYCGRDLGVVAIPGSDGHCGPLDVRVSRVTARCTCITRCTPAALTVAASRGRMWRIGDLAAGTAGAALLVSHVWCNQYCWCNAACWCLSCSLRVPRARAALAPPPHTLTATTPSPHTRGRGRTARTARRSRPPTGRARASGQGGAGTGARCTVAGSLVARPSPVPTGGAGRLLYGARRFRCLG
jgi:hypothetical protein